MYVAIGRLRTCRGKAMSVTILGPIKTQSIGRRRRPRPRTEKVFIAQPEPATRSLRRIVLRSLEWAAVISVILIVISAVASVFFYRHYASIVEHRVNAGFWQTR